MPKGSITNNIEFLVKVLLIREEWPDLYKEIDDNPFILNTINEFIDANNASIAGIGITNNKEGSHYELTAEQKRFFESNRDIHSDNLLAFFRNRDKYSGYTEGLRDLIIRQDWDYINKNVIDQELSIDGLVEYIDEIFNEEVNNKKALVRTGFNIVSLVMKMAFDDTYGQHIIKEYFSENSYFSQIRSHLNKRVGSEFLRKLDFNLLLAFSVLNKSKNRILIGEIASIIDVQDIVSTDKYIKEFYSDRILLSHVKSQFSSQLGNDVNRIKIVNSNDNFDNKVFYNSLIDEDAVRNLINITSHKQMSALNTQKYYDIVFLYNEFVGLKTKNLDLFIEKLVAPINNDIIDIGNKYWYNMLLRMSSSFDKLSKLDVLVNMFINERQVIGSYLNVESKSNANILLENYLEIFIKLYKCKRLTKSQKEKLISSLGLLFDSIEEYDVWVIVNRIYFEIIKIDNEWPFAENVSKKFIEQKGEGKAEELGKTMFAMLNKTSSAEGLSTTNIKPFISSLIEYTQDDKCLIEWLPLIENNKALKEFLIQVINELSTEIIISKLSIFKNLSIDTVEVILKKIIDDSIEKDSFDSAFALFKKADMDLTDFSNFFKNELNDLDYDEDFGILLKYIFSLLDSSLLNEAMILIIIDKLKLGFNTVNLTHLEISQSIRFIQDIIIPVDKKEDLIKSIKLCKRSFDFGVDTNKEFDTVINGLKKSNKE